jgi:Tol biopolymer transport system component/predicted Ser/Thr protein kinase
MPLPNGTRLGPYQIIGPLGVGGMGEVYRALDSRLGREVAIKVLPQAFASDPERLARFEREAKVLASLNHPHIAQIYGVEDGALVMELVEGEDLRGPQPVERALKYALQMAAALEAAHGKGIVHRDLKPGNVRITPEGAVKVLDFGLSKATDEKVALGEGSAGGTLSLPITQVGTMMGTAAYMSPEQAQGAAADPRADIWSFGAVVYELLAGKRAFPGRSVSETVIAVMGSEPDWSALPVQTPPAIRNLLRQCLRKDRHQRLQAIGDARIALEEPGSDRQIPAIERRTSRVVPWAVAGALAAIAAAGWWMEWQASRAADRPLMRLSVDLGADAEIGKNMTAAISPDGSRLVYFVHPHEGKTQLATRLLKDARATVLSGTEGASDPFFKPDGEWIGFFAGGKLKKVSIRGGAVVELCDAAGGRGGDWGEDGNIIATLDENTGAGLSRIPDRGGTPQAITNPADTREATHRWPQILPGGQTVLFTGNKRASNYDDSSLEVLSMKTRQVKVVQSGGYFGRYVETAKGAGALIYIHERTLFGVSFDPDRLEVRGTPTVLLDDVAAATQTAGGQFDYSRNGTFVYLSGKGPAGSLTLVWLYQDGKTQPLLPAPATYMQPRLSPDGKRLAFSNNTEIEIYDVGREAPARLNVRPQTTNFSPVWTPDGQHIVFESQGISNWSLSWIRSDGAGEAQPLLESKSRKSPHSFSPDGTRLAFMEQNAEGRYDLWTMSLDTSEPDHPKHGTPEVYLQTTSNEASPAFSPDGHWIAYTSDASGQDEVYVRPFPIAPGRWTVSSGGGRSPVWAPEGQDRELFYLAPDNRIMTAAWGVKANAFTFKTPSPWSNSRVLDGIPYLDRAPDGKRFVVVPAGEPEPVHVTFLLNFFDEVRRRIPAGK